MRKNWKRRLGVWGALTLLCLTVMPVLAANAQVVTADLGIRVIVTNDNGGTAEKADMAYTVDGSAATNFPQSGTIIIPLDPAVPHTADGVAHDGYTFTTSNCTDLTLTVGTPTICLITYDDIPPPTTTTTTTTTQPATTTTGKPGQTTIHDAAADPNACSLHLDPPLQPDSKPIITAVIATDASPQPHLGDPITLSNSSLGLTIPAGLLQAGVDIDFVHNGDQVPSVVTLAVAGSHTTEQTHTFVIHQTATIHTVKVPVSKSFPLGIKALPLNATLGLPDSHWTPVNGTEDVLFTEKSLKIVSTLSLKGGALIVKANFSCAPTTGASFVALGATGVPVTTPSAPGTTPGTGPGDTTLGPLAPPGSPVLPRTGSSPWPLIVLAAVLIDLGIVGVAAAKRRRRPLHH